jgi:epoxyqueuosine reductase
MQKVISNPSQFIKQEIKAFVRSSPANRLPFLDNYKMWDDPIVKFADADDPIFMEYKKIIAPTHLTPREALAKTYNKQPGELPERLSVISWVLPAVEGTRKANRLETRVPSRIWSHTRYYGEIFNEKLRTHVVDLLTNMGYLATAPFLQPYFKVFENEKGKYSNWSERHVAFAAGLGTFSLSDGFITEKGIAHRVGSVVTDLVLPVSKRTAKGPYTNCLAYLGVNCTACIERCPGGAITKKGHNKIKCHEYMQSLGYVPFANNKMSKDSYDNEKTVFGCGLCQTKVPCEFQNPAKKLKNRA